MTWSTVRNAIHAWAVTGSALDASKVVWKGQKTARPAVPMVELGVVKVEATPGWVDTTFADDTATYRYRRLEVAHIQVRVFGDSSVGDSFPPATISRMLAYLKLPTSREALEAAGVSVLSHSDPQWMESVMNGVVFEPRASVTVQFCFAQEVSETGNYIETVELESTIDG